MSKIKVMAGFLLAAAGLSVAVAAAAESLEQRVMRIERLLNNQVLMEQMQQMQQIRQELTELRGLVEDQEHQINMIKQRQRNLYQDMDRRLLELESSKPAAPVAAASMGDSYAPVVSPSTSSGIAAPGTLSSGTNPAVAPSTGAAPVADTDGKLAYSQAFALLKEGRYQQAIQAFRNFLQNFPQSKYAANALYWLGEANYVSRDYKAALQEFKKILSHYPDSNKVQGAELKIGYTYYEMKDWSSARTALNQVIAHYPNTTVARKAKERLERMKREGH